MNQPLLSVQDLTIEISGGGKSFQPVRNVSFDIMPGQMMGLVGESGSGKSLTAMSINRLLTDRAVQIQSGRIEFQGRDLTKLDERAMRKIRGNEIGTIFQEPMTALNPVFTLGDQISEPLRRHRGMNKKQAWRRAGELLDMVGIRDVDRVLNNHPHHLSGGMRQRAMIAMAMSCEPQLLIADEPTTALDVTTQLQILDLMLDLQEQHGTAVLLITHDLGVVAQTCETVAVMNSGEIVERAAVEDIFARPQHAYTKRLLSFMPAGRAKINDLDMDMDMDALVAGATLTATSTPVEQFEIHTPAPQLRAQEETTRPLLRVKDLVKIFPSRVSARRGGQSVLAVDKVSFSLQPGKTLAIVGESGSGKSTTGRLAMRLMEATSGEVEFEGRNLLALDAKELRSARARMQIIFQDTFASLDPRWTIGKLLCEPLALHTEMTKAEMNDRAAEILKVVGMLPEHLERYPHEFSGGQRQRIGIARALMLNPSLIVCDEPVSALDVSVQAQVLELMKDLQEQFGLSYIFISHDLSVVEMMADDVMVMSRGQVVEHSSSQQLFSHPKHPYTRALLAAIPGVNPAERVNRAERRRIVELGLATAVQDIPELVTEDAA